MVSYDTLLGRPPSVLTQEELRWLITQMAGFNPDGVFREPYTYLIDYDGTDYHAIQAGQTVYGGPDDAGAVDGGDLDAVLAAVSGSNRTIMFKGGHTYQLGTHISFSALNHVRFMGEDRTAILKMKPAHTAIFYGGGATDIEISNLSLDGNIAAQTGYSNAIVLAANCSNIRIYNNNIYDTASSAVSIGYLVGDITDIKIVNNTMTDIGLLAGYQGDGVTLEVATLDSLISGNTINTTGRFGICGFKLFDSRVIGNHVYNTGTISATGGHGITISESGNIVSENIVKDLTHASTYGIYLGENAVNNVITSNNVSNIAAPGIVLSGAGIEDNIVANNRVSDIPGFYGIAEQGGATNNTIEDNNTEGTLGTYHLTPGSPASSVKDGWIITGTLLPNKTNTPIAYIGQEIADSGNITQNRQFLSFSAQVFTAPGVGQQYDFLLREGGVGGDHMDLTVTGAYPNVYATTTTGSFIWKPTLKPFTLYYTSTAGVPATNLVTIYIECQPVT